MELTQENNCDHYKRGCKLIAPCCNKLIFCRLCHDEEYDHIIDRHAVKEICCKKCQHIQKIQQVCENCNTTMGTYFCQVCCLYDDTDKGQFHCEKCGICRVGGKENFFHCDKCNACISKSLKDKHKCIENVMKDVCPICRQYMFDSVEPISVMKCGHHIHQECMNSMFQTDHATMAYYRCPICQKSLVDFTEYWKKLDAEIANIQMPEEYANDMRDIICNDCSTTSNVKFHVIGMKCLNEVCGSYNTKMK
jgi:RING finger/CHY zinc finger protein 1